MKYRVNEKDGLFFPQKRGWSTVGFWEYFQISFYDNWEYFNPKQKNNIQPFDKYTRLKFKTLNEAEAFIDNEKIKRENRKSKIHKIK